MSPYIKSVLICSFKLLDLINDSPMRKVLIGELFLI